MGLEDGSVRVPKVPAISKGKTGRGLARERTGPRPGLRLGHGTEPGSDRQHAHLGQPTAEDQGAQQPASPYSPQEGQRPGARTYDHSS